MFTIRDIFNRILKYRPAIYGILAIWVMLFHIENRIGVPGRPGIITPLVSMGNVAVDVFLLLSGYCVHESWKRDPHVISFYFKRFLRILIPYLVFAIPLYLWKNIIEVGSYSIKPIIGDISTYNFWVHGMQTTWYVCAILLFYLLAPLFHVAIRKNKYIGVIVVLFTIILNQILWWILPSYSVTSIAWTRLPIFTLGIFLSCHGEGLMIKKVRFWKYLFAILAIILTMMFPYRNWYKGVFGDHPEYLWIGYIVIVPGLLILLYEVAKRLPRWLSTFLSIIGKVSLEVYIVHLFILRVLDYYKLQPVLKAWYYLIVTGGTIGIVLLYYFIKRGIENKFRKPV